MRVREAAGRAGRPVAILQDLPGPKLRIGALVDDRVELRAGDPLTFACGGEDGQAGDDRRMWISWPGLPAAVDPGDVLYLADGAVRMRVTGVRAGDGEVDTEIEIGGAVVVAPGPERPGPDRPAPRRARRGPRSPAAGQRIGVDMVALSFVRRPEDVTEVREHTRVPLIAKIEKPQAVERAEEIIRVADCVMVARGDLGIELPLEEVPIVQKRLIALAGSMARPVDHRDADARLDDRLAAPDARRGHRRGQRDPRRDGRRDALRRDRGRRPPRGGDRGDGARGAAPPSPSRPTRSGTSRASPATRATPPTPSPTAPCEAARQLHLDALVIPTLSGRSVRLVSAHRPQVPIYALSPGRETVRRCGLMWGVRAASMRRFEVTEELIAEACRRVVELGWCQKGQRVGVTAGLPSGRPGTTSLLQIQSL